MLRTTNGATIQVLRHVLFRKKRVAVQGRRPVPSRKSGETLQRITTAKNAASEDFQEWLRHKNLGSDVYVGMNTLKSEAHGRTKDDIETIRHLYLDIDRDGPTALEAMESSGLVPRPNYVLETSPQKYQVVWKVEGIAQE